VLFCFLSIFAYTKWVFLFLAKQAHTKSTRRNFIMLVTYFSASGVTANTAKELADLLHADVYEIEPEVPYTSADLDWTNKKSRSSLEMQDETARTPLKNKPLDVSKEDTILIGFPNWWGVAPRIINSFIESQDFSGKRIIVFETSGGSPVEPAVQALQKSYPNLQIEAGKRLASSKDVKAFAASI
jgi:hypothetical protein